MVILIPKIVNVCAVNIRCLSRLSRISQNTHLSPFQECLYPKLNGPFSQNTRLFSSRKKKVRVGDIPLLAELFDNVRKKDFDKAREAYDLIISSHSDTPHHRKNMITALLSLCDRADQLDFSLRLHHDLKACGIKPSESELLPLIKCASAKGDIPLAKQYLQEIIDANLPVRHRDTLPILQAIVSSSSQHCALRALEECTNLKDYNLYPRPQELEVILASAVQTGAIKEPVFREKLSEFITLINHTHCSIDHVSALRLHQAMHNGTVAAENEKSINFMTQVFKDGVLVSSKNDITGQVLSKIPLIAGQLVVRRACVIGHTEDELQLLRNVSQTNMRAQRAKHINEIKNVKAKGSGKSRDRSRSEPETVERLWTQVPELEAAAVEHNLAADQLDLYEVLGQPLVHSDPYSSPLITPSVNMDTPKAVRTRRHVDAHGIGTLVRDHHCATTVLCPHTRANLSTIPPTSVQYFLPTRRGSMGYLSSHESLQSDAEVTPTTAQTDTNSESVTEKCTHIDIAKTISSSRNTRSCRLVEVSQASSTCPNCGDTLRPLHMSPEDRSHVKATLKTLTTAASSVAGEKLEAFDKWLGDQEDFDFVIDAANVAYYNQNHKNGKFSFQQIELVYNALKQSQVTSDPRILVLIPEIYLQTKRRNAVTGQRTASSENDLKIISRLTKDNSLYAVPRHINDDWFVIHATLCGKRNSAVPTSGEGETWRPTYAVSNDFCRDHKLSFLSPRPFFRWRSTQVVFFDFNRSVHERNAMKKQNVTLTFPGLATREFQQSDVESSRWHLPIADRQSWLCLNT